MKKLIIALLFIVCGMSVTIADDFNNTWNWTEINCDITLPTIKSRPRSIYQYPRLFSDGQYIYIMSEANDYDNANIVITDEQGTIVKSDNVQITTEQVFSYYIGDLGGGMYNVRFMTDDFELLGNFNIE